jgi:hypothetical protein
MVTSISHSGAIDGASVGVDVGGGVGIGVGGRVGNGVGRGVGAAVGKNVTTIAVGAGVGAAGHGKICGTTGQTHSGHVEHRPSHPAKQHRGTPSESRSSVQMLNGFGGAPFPFPFPLPFPAFPKKDNRH